MRYAGFLMIGLVLFSAVPALAVSGAGAILLEFNTSTRANGMGNSGVATHWGEDPGAWANPALLAYQRGLRFTKLESQLVPDLADDIWLRDEHMTFGMAGFGLLYAKGPVDGSFLDMGQQEGTDDAGNPTGSFGSWMKAEQIGAGVSLLRLYEVLSENEESGLSRMFDVSVGYTHIKFEDALAPDSVTQGGRGGSSSATTNSRGVLARFTPLNTVGPTRASGPFGGIRIDLAYGRSVLNGGDKMLTHVDADQSDPLPRQYLSGWSVHVETGFPPDLRSNLEVEGLGWFAESLTPLLSFGYTDQSLEPGIIWNAETYDYSYGHDTSGLYDERSTGWELTLANIWSIRRGHWRGTGEIDGDTRGSSIGFTMAGYGGVRWDKATVPQATSLSRVKRESWTVWVDLVSLLD